MNNMIEGLKTKNILTKEHVASFRKYIDLKYPHYDKTKKILVLANSIQEVIYQNLQGLSEKHKKDIAFVIFQSTLAKGQEKIVYYDILHAFAHYSTPAYEMMEEIKQWLKIHTDHFNDIEEINDAYIKGLLDYIRGLQKEQLTLIPKEALPQSAALNLTSDLVKTDPKAFFSLRDILKPIQLYLKYISLEPFLATATSTFQQHLKALHNLGKIERNHPFYLRMCIGFILIIALLFPILQPQFIFLKADKTLNQGIENLYEVKLTSIPQLLDEIMAIGHMPPIFRYKEVNIYALQTYLHTKQSMLGHEPYFTTILYTAKQFKLNPLILFAIAGHEQGFVPKDHPKALEIANNPFNVFQSWQKYNTNIADASAIAARTVINLSKNRPADLDPFLWINRKYAEDPDWWISVRSIFFTLEDISKK